MAGGAGERGDGERDAGAPRPPGAGRPPAPDPLGKRALFSAPSPVDVGSTGTGGGTVDPVTSRGPIAVSCSSCGVTSRVGLLDFVLYQLPVGYWLPRGRFGHRMRCPSCRRRTWAGVTLHRD